MSAAKKTEQTLAKKLSSKVAITIPQKREAELKPELFAEIKNSKKSKQDTEDGLKNQRKTTKKSAIKVELQKDDTAHLSKQPSRATRANKVKKEDLDVGPEIETKAARKQISISLELGDIKQEKRLAKTEKKKTSKANVSPRSSQEIKEEHDEPKWEPTNWQLVLDNIRSMRSKDNAPVDTMGCHKCADENADEKTQRYHKLVALMLSSQTKDETTYHAMLRLREHTLTPESICEMKANVLENMLHPVSFYKNKAKYLQQTSKILVDNYNSDIPNNIKELVALPGVGPKMAHICMATAWHETRKFSSIRPGRKKTDPTVSQLRSLLYSPSGSIKFKVNFDHNYTELPIRTKQYKGRIEPKLLQTGRLPIPQNKWKHLQDLKVVIPEGYHYFYDNRSKNSENIL